MSKTVEATIVREYIKHTPIPEINPHINDKEDSILSFAVEKYDRYGKGEGIFNPTWDVDTETIEKLKKLKEDHPQIRVVISIGGYSSEFPFNPIENNKWNENAVKSIEHIIDLYGVSVSGKSIIDGIDIHYESIYSTEGDFSFYIGKLIRHLKRDKPLSTKLVSIAPTKLVESYYRKLYVDNNDIIDLVDYQFSKQTFTTKEQVVELYKKLVEDYTPALVLPGLNVPNDRILAEGILKLQELKLIPGVVYWGFPHVGDAPKSLSLQKLLQILQESTIS